MHVFSTLHFQMASAPVSHPLASPTAIQGGIFELSKESPVLDFHEKFDYTNTAVGARVVKPWFVGEPDKQRPGLNGMLGRAVLHAIEMQNKADSRVCVDVTGAHVYVNASPISDSTPVTKDSKMTLIVQVQIPFSDATGGVFIDKHQVEQVALDLEAERKEAEAKAAPPPPKKMTRKEKRAAARAAELAAVNAAREAAKQAIKAKAAEDAKRARIAEEVKRARSEAADKAMLAAAKAAEEAIQAAKEARALYEDADAAEDAALKAETAAQEVVDALDESDDDFYKDFKAFCLSQGIPEVAIPPQHPVVADEDVDRKKLYDQHKASCIAEGLPASSVAPFKTSAELRAPAAAALPATAAAFATAAATAAPAPPTTHAVEVTEDCVPLFDKQLTKLMIARIFAGEAGDFKKVAEIDALLQQDIDRRRTTMLSQPPQPVPRAVESRV
jgi:hypothetical protein